MKDTEVKRLVYQDDFAFNEGIKVGKKETIEKATQWLFEHVYDYTYAEDQKRVESFRKYLEDRL